MFGALQLGMGLTRRSGAFSPASLFAAGEVGVWYDPSDLTTLFTDTAGTTPVTTPGQTVALMRDKSGRSNHATQATTLSRPTYRVDGGGRPYLEFDGSDDFMLTGTITPGVDKAQVFAGVRKLSDAVAIVAETSGNAGANAGSFSLVSGEDLSSRYSSMASGSAGGINAVARWTSGGTAIDTAVLAATHDIPGDLSTIRRNGVLGVNGTANKGEGNFLAYPLYIGRRAGTTLPFNGHLYGLITRFSAANLDAATIGQTETWMNQRTGAY